MPMVTRLTVPSYAKVNYTLDVLSLRPDGYHNVSTVMQTISLADTIELQTSAENGIRIECDDPRIPADASNLAYRAAAAALLAARRDQGITIRLTKRIPSEAGLGGGSSNAAATLRAVNTLLALRLTESALQDIATELGSDVPFFLTGGTAAARGRGEHLTPLPDGPPFWFVIVKPATGVSTAWAYRTLDEISERRSARATRDVEALVRSGDAERLAARMTNDFEQAIAGRLQPIELALDDLVMARARNTHLCGSGSAVFGLAFTRPEAEEIARIVRLKYELVYVCRSITREESLGKTLVAE